MEVFYLFIFVFFLISCFSSQDYKKKAKKHKKRASGMDFCNSGKKKKSGTSSRDASRAGTPERGEGAGNSNEENGGKVTYALDNVVAESKGWVLDKGAGETILVR